MLPRRNNSRLQEEDQSNVALEGTALDSLSRKLSWKYIVGLAAFLSASIYYFSVIVPSFYVGVN
jgi:hypothetical protein